MKEYADIINAMDVLKIVENKITVEELKQNKLEQFFRFCKDDNEKKEALQYVEEAFSVISPFLSNISLEEYDAIIRYGNKIGTVSYEINESLRNNLPLSSENKNIINLIDSAMDKFNLDEELVVYRALKQSDIATIRGTDKGYMSTSLTIENSYAYFEDYEIVLEIKLPVGSKCMYIEWFKGSTDELELILGRGTTIDIGNMRKEIINGKEKNIYSCTVLQKDLEINNKL